MKIPLHYQISDYDCGPTSMLNAIAYLFERDDVPPEVVRNIMLYSLDSYGANGKPGRRGTSSSAMLFLSGWLNDFGSLDLLPISTEYLSGEQVFVGTGSRINDALHRGGVAVVRLFLDEWHYVLFTRAKNGHIYLFDPYDPDEPYEEEDVIFTKAHPYHYNCIVTESRLNREVEDLYSLCDYNIREAVILYNKNTKITAEDSIEYFI